MAKPKLNVLLAKTDHLQGIFKKNVEDNVKHFKGSQGDYKGEQKTYTAKTGTIDLPNERKTQLVVTTVAERLRYLHENTTEYIDSLFSQEKSNASGIAKAVLIVDGINFGELTSLELLRLKSILEQGVFKEMYEAIPTRSDSELWYPHTSELYGNRAIMQSEKRAAVVKTTVKEDYILPDPNLNKDTSARYTPQLAKRDTVVELGDSTYQKFSGEASHVERAGYLARKSRLLSAVIEALKVANEVESVSSEITADKLFGYLHGTSK